MGKRVISFILVLAVCITLTCGIGVQAAPAERYKLRNPWVATGTDIINEARRWAGTGAVYRSGVEPWEESVKWRTGYTGGGKVSFDCSGFVGRVLNDCGFRAVSYTPPYGNTILSQTYKRGYIAISIEELVNYGTDLSDAVAKAKNGDYSDLQPGDVIGWTGGTLGRHVIFYAGLNEGVPWMVEMTGRGFLDRAITQEYQQHFQYGARFAASAGQTQLFAQTYPASGRIAVRETASVMSLPCARETDSRSGTVETLYREDPPSVATGLIRNSQGEYWYQVQTPTGKTGYLKASQTEYQEDLPTLYGEGITVPANHTAGQSYSLTGFVSAKNSHMTKLSFLIYPEQDLANAATGASLAVTGSGYNLGGSTIDRRTAFGALQPGKYICRVAADFMHYYVTEAGELAVYTDSGQAYEASFFVTDTPVTCNHNYSMTELSKRTCEQQGIRRYSCSRCGSSYTEYLAATEHKYYVRKIPASLSEGEKISYTCQNCGLTHIRYTGVVYQPGDMDVNGLVNTDDVVALLLHISMPDTFPMEQAAADLDGSGQVNVEDAVLLLLHISMPDVYPIA